MGNNSKKEEMRYLDKLVSIVVPVHNAEKYLSKTIESVRAQTYPDWELILVDDCSKDGTSELYETLLEENIIVIKLPTNSGAATARNTGLTQAQGRYLAFLDADDIWRPEKLEQQLKYMKKNGVGFVFSSYEYGDEEGVGNGKIAHVPECIDYKGALKNTIIFTSTVLFDRTIIPNELLRMPKVPSEDSATWWQILKKGYFAYGIDEALVIYRRPVKSLSSNKFEAIKRIWNLYRKVEKLSIPLSCYYFVGYAFRTVLRRL